MVLLKLGRLGRCFGRRTSENQANAAMQARIPALELMIGKFDCGNELCE